MTYLGFNTEKEPFNDENVRLAIASAIDKCDHKYIGRYTRSCETPLNPTVFGHSDDLGL